MLRVLHNTKVNFIDGWRVTSVIIAIFLIPGLLWAAIDGFKVGVEFTGGTVVQYEFQEPPDLAVIRTAVTGAGFAGAEVQTFGSPSEIVVRAQDAAEDEGAGTVSTRVTAALQEQFGAEALSLVRTEAIGPRVGAELRKNAIFAMLISFAVTLMYLAWRFDGRLALAAVAANVHDIIATFAFIKYMQIEMSLFVVGGILTVIGYSLNDKVVVFDRVRELLRQAIRRPLRDTLNAAINQTLPRTVLTGVTVLACLTSLIVLGGEVLRPFAWVLFFGIVVGTFSSIYVASPILLLIERRWPRHEGETKGMSRALAEERRSERKQKVPAGKQ